MHNKPSSLNTQPLTLKQLTMVKCEVVRNGGVGVLVHRAGADARLEECVVSEHSEMGVAVQVPYILHPSFRALSGLS